MKHHNVENVAILATSHNVAKAYISRINSAGIKLSRVVLLNKSKADSAIQSRVLKLIKTPKKSIKYIVKSIIDKAIIDKKPVVLSKSVLDEIRVQLNRCGVYSCDFTKTTKEYLTDFKWAYEQIDYLSINDRALIAYLQRIPEQYIIFTGGGILREEILNIGKSFIHVHPGVVPAIKGADCLLWSALVDKKIGMSAFFMNKGIDTGDIIKTKTYPIPGFNFNQDLSTDDIRNYLINHVDPHYRADLLVELFVKDNNPGNWNKTVQDPKEGKQYFFMHKNITNHAIKLFLNKNDVAD